MKGVSILGSTGSIGRQALEIIDFFPDQFQVIGLSAGHNLNVLRQQVEKYKPRIVSVASMQDAEKLQKQFAGYDVEFLWGNAGLAEVATAVGADTVLTAVSGVVGLQPTAEAIKAGKDIALANKETLVAGGAYITALAEKHKVKILPVDSEHSAIWQCLKGSSLKEVKKIILTASGGPFRKEPEDLSTVNVEMTLKHPNWSMGRKITVDSATMMNKGLEVIEARWLFDLDYSQIEVVVHPQSIIHSMVEFVDGSVLAQLGYPDMRLPIQYALGYPSRLQNNLPGIDWLSIRELTFEAPDTKRFPLLKLAYEAGCRGGSLPAAMNAANEVAVELFLKGKIDFLSICKVVEEVMGRHVIIEEPDLNEIIEADRQSRESAYRLASD